QTPAPYTLSLHDALPICTVIDPDTVDQAQIDDVVAQLRIDHAAQGLHDPVGQCFLYGVVHRAASLPPSMRMRMRYVVPSGSKARSEEHTSELQSRENLVC